jgi:glycosyltransferase involved in cell wall biosynthesis
MTRAIRVVAVIEASTVTGPAKNLIRFWKMVRQQGGGLDVSFVTFFRGSASGSNPFVDAVRSAGIEIDLVPERFALDGRVPGLLRGVIERRKPAVVQTHGVKSHFLIRLARLDRSFRWMAFHHGYTAEDLKMRAYNGFDRWSLRSARRVVTVCGPFAEELERKGVARSRIEILPNSIDTWSPAPKEAAEALRARLGIRPGEKIVLSIGRLSREKGHFDLVAAADALSRTLPGLEFRVIIAGEGPERSRIEAAGQGGRIVLAGHMGDVRPLYAIADVFVLPSYSEGSPNVLLESMAAGVPIVANSVGGVPETVVNESSALLTRAGDPDSIAAGIGRVLTDHELSLRLSENGRAEAARRSPEAYRQTLTRIYEAVTTG